MCSSREELPFPQASPQAQQNWRGAWERGCREKVESPSTGYVCMAQLLIPEPQEERR